MCAVCLLPMVGGGGVREKGKRGQRMGGGVIQVHKSYPGYCQKPSAAQEKRTGYHQPQLQ